MDKNQIIETLQELPSDTAVKAWLFQVEGKFYQVAVYTVFRAGEKTSVWECSKKGKRATKMPIFTMYGGDPKVGVEKFIDTL